MQCSHRRCRELRKCAEGREEERKREREEEEKNEIQHNTKQLNTV